ncbi:hypothetical protein CVM73_15830 [Bradyrhizobium forestalis]|uniref:Uncharacterized protein n=1 Tax=Bradyrhizobium forestalis TaxID=1419263 RepID=A0A2M8R901_9BRAD|nr:hypothetical protein CVM73_15830 [Bradyrhizobium forestalis]
MLPVIAWLLLIACCLRSGARICTGWRGFYAVQSLRVLPETVLLCLILLQAIVRFHKRTMSDRSGPAG